MPLLAAKVNKSLTPEMKKCPSLKSNQVFLYGPWSCVYISNDLFKGNLSYWTGTKSGTVRTEMDKS